jgi:hypothetical protein
MKTSDTFPPLTNKQLKAVKSFIKQHQSWCSYEPWHTALLRAWRCDCGPDVRAGILHSLRNTHGPTWLQLYVDEQR